MTQLPPPLAVLLLDVQFFQAQVVAENVAPLRASIQPDNDPEQFVKRQEVRVTKPAAFPVFTKTQGAFPKAFVIFKFERVTLLIVRFTFPPNLIAPPSPAAEVVRLVMLVLLILTSAASVTTTQLPK